MEVKREMLVIDGSMDAQAAEAVGDQRHGNPF
jgi:hypothetical protein